jgi:hypothetical protein
VVQTITSSVDFVTGSTRFGSISANTHQFTGSVSISGSLTGASASFSSALAANNLTGEGQAGAGGVLNLRQDAIYLPKGNGYSSIASSFSVFEFYGYTGASTYKNFTFRFDGLTDNTRRDYTLPDTSGTLALLSGSQTFNGATTFASAAGITNGNGLNLRAGGNTASDANVLNFTSLAGTINLSMFSDAANSNTRLKSLGNLSFHTGDIAISATNERMTITSGGNVLIGTTTDASYKLQVQGTFRATGAITQFASAGYYVDMNYIGATYNFGSGETTDNIDFKIAGGSTFTTGGNFRFYTQTGNTTPSERMRISANGKVTITAPAHNQLTIKDSDASLELGADDSTMIGIGMVTAGDGITWFTGRHRPGSAGIYDEMNVARLSGTWVNLFRIYSNGNWDFAGSDVSDIRLKENIEVINYNATEKLLQLVPKSYNMIEHPTISKSGFIAQDVKEILPSFVTGNESENEYLGVDYNGILALAVKAIQELKAENDTLKEILQRNNIQ